MQTQDKELVDLLKHKDESYNVPREFSYVRKNKNRFLIEIEERGRYDHMSAAHCIDPCFRNFDSAIINTAEHDCMVNCVNKAQETRALFDQFKFDKRK